MGAEVPCRFDTPHIVKRHVLQTPGGAAALRRIDCVPVPLPMQRKLLADL